MIRTIRRTLSSGNLSNRKPRVRFAPTPPETRSEEGSSGMGETFSRNADGEGSTMADDTSSANSSGSDSMSVPVEENSPGCSKEEGMDFEGVAVESFRALILSACLVSETVMAAGSEIVQLQRQCGMENTPMNTSEKSRRFAGEAGPDASGRRGANGAAGNTDSASDDDDSSTASYPPSSRKKRRRNRRFPFFGVLSNRAKKNFLSGPPSTVTTTPNDSSSEMSAQRLGTYKKVPSKKPAPAKASTDWEPPPLQDPFEALGRDRSPVRWPTCSNTKAKDLTATKSRDHSPARAKKLLTACFVKRHGEDDMTDAMTTHSQSRYRTDHEDLELRGEHTVYTIRLSRVQSAECEDL